MWWKVESDQVLCVRETFQIKTHKKKQLSVTSANLGLVFQRDIQYGVRQDKVVFEVSSSTSAQIGNG